MSDLLEDEAAQKHLTKLLQTETDRGCALVGGAMLDEALGQLLEACMVAGKPPQNFGARLTLATSFGFITEDERVDIGDVKDIRNGAAHALGTADEPWEFKSEENKERCYRLRAFNFPGMAARPRFVGAIVGLAVTLQQRAALVREARAAHGQAAALTAAIDDAVADTLADRAVPEGTITPDDYVEK